MDRYDPPHNCFPGKRDDGKYVLYEDAQAAIAAAHNDALEEAAKKPAPNLGCATTRELLDELWARIEVDGRLDYRTVDPH